MIGNVLTSDLVRLEVPGETKQQVIESLLDILMETGKVEDRRTALTALLEREEKMSTGIENGIAIPHGKTTAVKELVACVGLKKEGIDFDSLDGKPSKIFIMTLSPKDKSGPHIQFLAEISSLLKDEKGRNEILAAKTPQEVLDVILYP
jgi:fructose-specific phosphotransferase system IIA component